MELLLIHGSARKQGNSAFIAERIAEAATGAKVTRHYLYDLHFKSCTGCMSCRKKSDTCVLKDDLAQVLHDIHVADIVVFATPNYNGGPTGEMTALINRCFSFSRTDYFEKRAVGIVLNTSRLALGKTAVALMTQGQDEQGINQYGTPYVFTQYTDNLKAMGFSYVEDFRCCRLNSSKDAPARADLLTKAEVLGKELALRYS